MYDREYLLSLAAIGPLLDREYRAALEADSQRWDVHSDLGVSLHAMRQLGHWRPFTRSSRRMFAELVVAGIEPATPEPQRSRRVGPPTTRSRPACASWLARLLMRGSDAPRDW